MTPVLAQRSRVDRAFERLYERHVGDVYRYSLALLRHPADAEDVTQTTFMNAYRAFQQGKRPRNARNWLIAIAHNVCRQRFRQSARRPREVALEDNDAETIVDDEAPKAEDLRRALGQLAFNQRAALVMRELEGRSYAEIADLLGLSTSAVETLIFRARRALREQLEGALTCREAELAVSRQLDGRLPRSERGALRAHLRACGDCAAFARRQRAQRVAFRSLAAVPLPSSLASFFGGGGAAGVAASSSAGGAIAAKAAAAVAAGVVTVGVGYEGVKQAPWRAQGAEPRAAKIDRGGRAEATPRQPEHAQLHAGSPSAVTRVAARPARTPRRAPAALDDRGAPRSQRPAARTASAGLRTPVAHGRAKQAAQRAERDSRGTPAHEAPPVSSERAAHRPPTERGEKGRAARRETLVPSRTRSVGRLRQEQPRRSSAAIARAKTLAPQPRLRPPDKTRPARRSGAKRAVREPQRARDAVPLAPIDVRPSRLKKGQLAPENTTPEPGGRGKKTDP